MMRLGLNRDEINTFYRSFNKVDNQKQNSISIKSLLNYLKIDATPLTMRAFGELDLSADGMLNFREVCYDIIVMKNKYLVVQSFVLTCEHNHNTYSQYYLQ